MCGIIKCSPERRCACNNLPDSCAACTAGAFTMMNGNDDVCWALMLESSNLDFVDHGSIIFSFIEILWTSEVASTSPSSLIDIYKNQMYSSLPSTSWERGWGWIVMTICLWLVFPIIDSVISFRWPDKKASRMLSPEVGLRLKRFGCYRRTLDKTTRTDRDWKKVELENVCSTLLSWDSPRTCEKGRLSRRNISDTVAMTIDIWGFWHKSQNIPMIGSSEEQFKSGFVVD